MAKIVINQAAVERVLNQAAQKIQNDPALRVRIPPHVTCDAPGCSRWQDLSRLIRQSPEALVDAIKALGWSLDGGRTLCPAHTIHMEGQ